MSDEIVPQNADEQLSELVAQGRVTETENGLDVWMTASEIAAFFGVTRQAVSLHVHNYEKQDPAGFREFSKDSLRKSKRGRPDLLYNLDLIIYVGYRVNSTERARLFRDSVARLVKSYLAQLRNQLASAQRENHYLKSDNERLEDRVEDQHATILYLKYPNGAPGDFLTNTLPKRDRD